MNAYERSTICNTTYKKDIFPLCSARTFSHGGIVHLYDDRRHFRGTIHRQPLAAVNLAFPVIMILFAVGDMVAVGSSVKIALLLGQGKNKEANGLFSAAFCMILGIGVLFSLVGFFAAPKLITLLIKDTTLANVAWDYARIFLYFMPAIMPLFAVDNYLRICGKANFSMWMNISVAVLNIFLDWFFLAYLRLDIRFAALATSVSMTLGVLIAMTPIFLRKLTLRFTRPRISLSTTLGIFHNGSSEFFNNISGSFMSTVVNAFLLHLGGGTAVAAYGIVMYLDSLLLMALYGILDSLQPPVSYNIGAGNHQKAREFFRLSCKVTAAISLACLLAMVCFPRELASLFLQENSAEVLEMTVTALRLYAPAYLFLWLNMVISSFLTAMDRAKDSLTIMLFRALIFPSLSLAIFPQILDVTGIFITPAISGALTVIISTTIWRRLGKQQPQEA